MALVAPAGRINGAVDVERGIANVRSLNHQPVVGANAQQQLGYFAGSDEQRLADLNQALGDPSVDAVWCLRGGYGVMRLLERVDYGALRARPKALIGYSDITALHSAVNDRAQLVTFHGPVARATLTPFARESLQRALAGRDPFVETAGARSLAPGCSTGRLAGGNLALLASLAGTPFAPSFDGAIVIMEDVYEAVYRIDRMLTQLRLSGMLRGCRGLAFGHFTEIPREDPRFTRPLEDVLAETAELLGVPCVADLPIGHVDDQWTVPLGAAAELDADAATLRLLV
jgi:muramoyltetrapeptide carboxypeptidase